MSGVSSSSSCESSLISSSSVISSCMSSPTYEPPAVSEHSRHFLIIIPRFGTYSVHEYDNVKSMIKKLTYWLDQKQRGIFEGDILAFHGQMIEYSLPVMQYRVNIPGVGELAISESVKDKFIQPPPKKERE